MTFNAYETSIDEGRPIKLYRFTLGSTVWRYTSADHDQVIGGETWLSIAVQDDGVKQTGSATTDALQITGPITMGPAQVYMACPPAESIMVSMLEKHLEDSQVIVTYTGEISQVNFPQPGTAVISCQTLGATMARSGLTLGWRRTCPYNLYDPVTCKVSRAAWAVAGTLSAVNAFTVTGAAFAALPDGHFNGGYIEWAHPVRGNEAVAIESHTGAVLTIFGETTELYPGLPVTAYPGCSLTTESCNRFGNLNNFGGVPHMPGKSPYDGNPVF